MIAFREYCKNIKSKRVNENSANDGGYTLKGLMLGYDADGKYALTVEGFEALYRTLYSGDIDMLMEFCGGFYEAISQYPGREDDAVEVWGFFKEFICDKILGDCSDKKVIETIESQDSGLHYKIGNMSDLFEEGDDEEDWAYGVKSLLGLPLPKNENE